MLVVDVPDQLHALLLAQGDEGLVEHLACPLYAHLWHLSQQELIDL